MLFPDFVLANDSTNPPMPDAVRARPLKAPLSIRITFDEDSGGGAIPDGAFLYIRVEDAPIFIGLVRHIGTIPSLNGVFRVNSFVGATSISMENLPPGYLVKSMLAGSTDLLKAPLEVPSDTSAVPEIVITLEKIPANSQK